MKWNIITDSSCDMFGFDKEHENIVFSSVPFTISVGDENFVDDRNLDVDGMIDGCLCIGEPHGVSVAACVAGEVRAGGQCYCHHYFEQALRQLQQRVRRKRYGARRAAR